MADDNGTPTPDPLSEAFQAAIRDPDLGPDILAALKKKNPNLNLPSVDLRNQIKAVQEAADKRVNEVNARFEKSEAERHIERERNTLKSKGLTDEEIKTVEERMTKGELSPNYEHAGRHFLLEKQAATPTPPIANRGQPRPKTFVVPEDSMKTQQGMTQWSRDEAYKFLDEKATARR